MRFGRWYWWVILLPGLASAEVTGFGIDPILPMGPPNAAAVSIQWLIAESAHPKLRWRDFTPQRMALQRLYEQNNYQWHWLRDGKPTAQAAQIAEVLAAAEHHGLNSLDYDGDLFPQWNQRLAAAETPMSVHELALYDTALSISVMRYGDALSRGRINPRGVNAEFDTLAKQPDPVALARAVSTAGDARAALASYESQLPSYRALKDALRIALRSTAPDAQQRIAKIQVAMERMRWLPQQIDSPFIVVNVPSYQLFAYRNSTDTKPALAMNVIVGEAENAHHTPIFHATMSHLIFRPYWNVPRSITIKELLPRLRKDPNYLARHDMEVVSNFNQKEGIALTDDALAGISSGALKIRQKPGPKNALGLVKFMFPNNNNIYLHSTPAKQLFQRSRRDFSHGCIRVQDPVALAQFVLKNHKEWTLQRIETAMAGDKQKVVNLAQHMPVFIFYSTVMADESGALRFFDDIYGYDAQLEAILANGFPYTMPERRDSARRYARL